MHWPGAAILVEHVVWQTVSPVHSFIVAWPALVQSAIAYVDPYDRPHVFWSVAPTTPDDTLQLASVKNVWIA